MIVGREEHSEALRLLKGELENVRVSFDPNWRVWFWFSVAGLVSTVTAMTLNEEQLVEGVLFFALSSIGVAYSLQQKSKEASVKDRVEYLQRELARLERNSK